MSRANPFGDLDDFAPHNAPKPVPAAAIDKIAEASGFPSRKAAAPQAPKKAEPAAEKVTHSPEASSPARQPRRRTTGRNRQINIKATEETIETLYRLADEMDLPLGAVLERALEALASAKA